jgi:hypothetical protein
MGIGRVVTKGPPHSVTGNESGTDLGLWPLRRRNAWRDNRIAGGPTPLPAGRNRTSERRFWMHRTLRRRAVAEPLATPESSTCVWTSLRERARLRNVRRRREFAENWPTRDSHAGAEVIVGFSAQRFPRGCGALTRDSQTKRVVKLSYVFASDTANVYS